ncbi:hypothetical protein ACFV6E_21480 [Streptomyces sp. NPDC059785]|uniref:hypothetical protein n=1 Tax=unclassified Streptomyces TaxID=2593676 RepID=UPI00365F1C0A
MTTSRMLRHVVPGGVILALGVPASATAGGGGESTEPRSAAVSASARGGSPQSTVDHVADFYGSYIDVLYDTGRGRLSGHLRSHYLTAGLRASLARWEATHHKDGVLREKGVPIAWEAVYNDSGTGHCRTRVTLTWQHAGKPVRHTHLMVQSDLATRLISGIRIDE